jgi:hypothetical protein
MADQSPEASAVLLRELVSHLRQNRTQLRQEWARRITEAKLLTAMTQDEILAEATSVYDNYVEALETGTYEALQAYSRNLSERIIPRGVETHEVLGIVLRLRDVLARSLFATYQDDFGKLNRILDAYEPAANRIANTVAVGFVQERERVIREQQEAIRELSTPVLQVRERLLIPAHHRRDRPPTGAPAHRAAPERDPHQPREGGGDRHHRCGGHGFPRGEPPGADRGGLEAPGGHGDRHRALSGNRADPGHHRRRPGEDEHGR